MSPHRSEYSTLWDLAAPMVLILDGNSEIGVHIRSNLCFWTCFRHLIHSGAVTIGIFSSPKWTIFLHHVPIELTCNPSTMVAREGANNKTANFAVFHVGTRRIYYLDSDPGIIVGYGYGLNRGTRVLILTKLKWIKIFIELRPL